MAITRHHRHGHAKRWLLRHVLCEGSVDVMDRRWVARMARWTFVASRIYLSRAVCKYAVKGWRCRRRLRSQSDGGWCGRTDAVVERGGKCRLWLWLWAKKKHSVPGKKVVEEAGLNFF